MGHSPPYVAVITLGVMTAHHWRSIRQRLISAGIADPMALTSMHALLDITESALVESMSHGRDSEAKRTSFYDKLYAPTPTAVALNGDKYRAAPPGFEDEEVEASFDAFLNAAR